jgi:putative transcriptional regulator
LAGEVGEGAWACVPGSPDDVLSELAGPELWRRVMGRQTGRLAVLSTAPADPSAN